MKLLAISSVLLAGAIATVTNATVLNSGAGEGTYYYNADAPTCGLNTPETQAYTYCESWQEPWRNKKLGEYHNNYIVAIDRVQLQTRRAELCGKRVIVKYNDQVVPGNFVVWDACEACSGGVRLDFSSSALETIDPEACTKGKVPGVSWEVVDEQVMEFHA